MSGHGVAVMGQVLRTWHRDQLLDLQVEGAIEERLAQRRGVGAAGQTRQQT